MPAATSYDLRDKVVYELIHDVQAAHWEWYFSASGAADGHVVLDCGCGYGACTRELIQRHPASTFIVDLVDESPVQLERAKQQVGAALAAAIEAGAPSGRTAVNFVNLSAKEILSFGRRYDLIFLKMVLHEVPRTEQSEFLNLMHELLRPGGLLLIWDLALADHVAPFFRDVIKKKDELLHFRTLFERRYFLTQHEFDRLAAESSFRQAEAIRLFDCDFFSERRIDCEFKGDSQKYRNWLVYVQDALASLDPQTRKLLNVQDRTEDSQLPQVKFCIRRGIWRLTRVDTLTLVNTRTIATGVQPHLEPSSARADLAQRFQETVRRGISMFRQHRLLPEHQGLIRVTTFDLKDRGRRELSKSGTDFLYCFRDTPIPDGDLINAVTAAYFRHMCLIYHRKATSQGKSADTLTDYLNGIGGTERDLSSLRVIWTQPSGPNRDELQLTLRTASRCTSDVLVIEGLDRWCTELEQFYRLPEIGLDFDPQNELPARLQCGPDKISIDLVAQRLVEGQERAPMFGGKLWWQDGALRGVPDEAVLGFAAFLKRSGLRYATYVMPPAPLQSPSGRKNLTTVFFSSDRELSSYEERVVLAFISKVWGEIRGIELVSANTAFLNYAYKEEVLNRSDAKRDFVVSLILPLLCGGPETKIRVTDLIKVESTTAVTPRTGSIFNDWAINWSTAFTRDSLPTLIKYLQLDRERLSTAEKEVLQVIRHDLKLTGSEKRVELLGKIERARKHSRAGGPLFDQVSRMLDHMAGILRELPKEGAIQPIIDQVRSRLLQIEQESRIPVLDVCLEHQSEELPTRVIFDNNCDTANPPPLRFRLTELQAAANALRDNNASKNSGGKFSLRYTEDYEACVLTWLESLPNEWSLSVWSEKLLASARQNGVHRGLPRVVLFGFESSAARIEFLSGRQWLEVWPNWGDSRPSQKAEHGYNYGYRFTI